MIETEQLRNFIDTLNNAVVREMEFDVWIHRVFDKTFNDWRDQMHGSVDVQNAEMTKEEVKTTVQKSLEILGDFTPDEGE